MNISAYLSLTRPVNVLIGGLSIFVGAAVTGTVHPLSKVFLACLSACLIAAGANAINDYFDVEIDRCNKPLRPLPAGNIPLHSAYIFSITLLAGGTLTGAAVSSAALGIAMASSLMLYVYSLKLKRTVLFGNIAVAVVTGLAFIYGGVAVQRPGKALIPAIFAFLFHFGREIIKDIEDVEGDVQEAAKTLPIRHGKRVALSAATAVFSTLIIATLIPYALHLFGGTYLAIVLLGVDGVIIYVILSMWCNPIPSRLHFLSVLLKADMFVGLVAIYFGR